MKRQLPYEALDTNIKIIQMEEVPPYQGRFQPSTTIKVELTVKMNHENEISTFQSTRFEIIKISKKWACYPKFICLGKEKREVTVE